MLNPGDDIEDMYRDFAEKYPLKAGESDWDEFSQKMSKASSPERRPPAGFSGYGGGVFKRRLSAIAALLLITLTILLVKVYQPGKTRHVKQTAGEKSATATAPVKPGNDTITKKDVNNTTAQQSVTSNNAVKQNAATLVNTVTSNNAASASGKNIKNSAVNKIAIASKPAFSANNQSAKFKVLNSGGKTGSTQTEINRQTAPLASQPANSITENNTAATSKTTPANDGSPVDNTKGDTKATGESNIHLNNTTTSKTDAVAPAKSPITINTKFRKYFYVSLLFGPDLSTVKYQNIKGPGLSGGIMAGYQFTKKLSVETGFLLDRKLYYSDGKYFNKSSVNLSAPGDNILSVDGDGTLFEIPVAVRYSFAGNKNHNLFVSAGMSSYFIQKERYDLSVQHTNGMRHHQHDDDDDFTNIFSVVQASVGYELKLNQRNFLRIEPYIKVPLSGIGKGSLPLTSNGVYINFTHAFK